MKNERTSYTSWLSVVLIVIGITFITLGLFYFIFSSLGSYFFGFKQAEVLAKSADSMTFEELKSLKLTLPATGFGLLASAFICALTLRLRPITYFTLNKIPTVLQILLVVAIWVISIPAIEYAINLNDQINFGTSVNETFRELQGAADRSYEAVLKLNQGVWFPVNLLLMALLPAIAEEFFFRGFIQKRISQAFGNIHVGVLLSSLIFALIHQQIFRFIPMVMLSLIMGYIYAYSGKIWLNVLFHFLNNAAVVVFAYLENDALLQLESPIYLSILSVFATVAILWVWHKKVSAQSLQEIS